MVMVKFWIQIVLSAPVLLATGHPSPSPPSVSRQGSNGISIPPSSSLPRHGFNAAARSAGKLYFGTATNNSELTDAAYVAVLDDLAMFGQITPSKVMKWVRTSRYLLDPDPQVNRDLCLAELHRAGAGRVYVGPGRLDCCPRSARREARERLGCPTVGLESS